MNEKISVVITTFGRNYASITRSIDSVLRQSYTNFEIILIDDNGLGNQYQIEIEQKTKDIKKIEYIAHETNKGAQEARNTGINRSSGTLIAFLDDDDEWYENKLEEQIKAIDENVGLVYCMGKTINEETGESSDYMPISDFKKDVDFDDLLFSDYIGTTTQALIPKYIFDKVGKFDINQPARQDYEMWLRISKKFKCVGIASPLFKHYVHNGEQISKSNKKGLIGLKNIYQKYKDDYNNNSTASFHINYIMAKKYLKGKEIFAGFICLLKSAFFFVKSFLIEHKRFNYYIKKGYKKHETK